MTRPEQKRLRREFARLCPQSSSLAFKLRRVFGGGAKETPRQSDPSTTMEIDEGQHIIGADAVDLCRELGRGEFGVCYQGTWRLPQGDAIQVRKLVEVFEYT